LTEEAAMNSNSPTLYERLGGVYATVVDDFIDRVMNNPILNANPAVKEAHHRVSPAGFKYLVTEMVCWASGGPQQYTGRAMRESHEQLKITEAEWAAFCKDFDDCMAKFAVPEGLRRMNSSPSCKAQRVTSSPSQVDPPFDRSVSQFVSPTLARPRWLTEDEARRIAANIGKFNRATMAKATAPL
jgi:hemoglobin